MNHFEKIMDSYLSNKETKTQYIDTNNIICYHDNILESYANVLSQLKIISPSGLKYARKTMIVYNNEECFFHNSDVHIEIDFELLGVIEYGLFFEIFRHLVDNMVVNKKFFYIVCLHFHIIQQDLLDVFYNFLNYNNINFIFVTNQISFLPNSLLKSSKLKRFKSLNKSDYNKTYKDRSNEIIELILSKKEGSFSLWRDKIYDLLIWNDCIHDALSYIIQELILNEYIQENSLSLVFEKYYEIIKMYNNNYRSIYHLEHFIHFLRNINTKS